MYDILEDNIEILVEYISNKLQVDYKIINKLIKYRRYNVDIVDIELDLFKDDNGENYVLLDGEIGIKIYK